MEDNERLGVATTGSSDSFNQPMINGSQFNGSNENGCDAITQAAASDNENSTNSTWSNSRSSMTTTTSRRLNLVLPTNKKGTLQTPTIITSEPTNVSFNTVGGPPAPQPQTATSQLLLDSLVQFNGQDGGVSLFTGLPSCTPTSADRLTGINPFFWGATSFANNEQHSATIDDLPLISDSNNQTANRVTNGDDNDVSPRENQDSLELQHNNQHHQRQQQQQQQRAHSRDHLMVKLARDHGQGSNNLSPIIFSPISLFGLSPEQEALIRFGVFSPNQHPLAGRSATEVDLEQLSQQYNAHHALLQHHHHHHHHHHQHQQQQHQQQQQQQQQFQHQQQTQHQVPMHHYPRDLTNQHQFNNGSSSSATMPTVQHATTIYSLEPHHHYHHHAAQSQPKPHQPQAPLPPPQHVHHQHIHQQPKPVQQPHQQQTQPVLTEINQQHPGALHNPHQNEQNQALIELHPNGGQPIGLFEPQIRRIYLQYHHHQQQQRQQQQQQQQSSNSQPISNDNNARATSFPPTTVATNHETLSRSASSSNISATSNYIDPLATGSGTCSPIKRHDTLSPAPIAKTNAITIRSNGKATSASTSNIASGKTNAQTVDNTTTTLNNATNNKIDNDINCTTTISNTNDNSSIVPAETSNTGEVIVKKKSKGGRKKKLVSHEEMIARKNRSKERNRVAAKRCRQKRKQFLDTLRDRIDSLNELNTKLMKENSMLKSELDLLKRQQKS